MDILIEFEVETSGAILPLKRVINSLSDYNKFAEDTLKHVPNGTYFISEVQKDGKTVNYLTTLTKFNGKYSFWQSDYDKDVISKLHKTREKSRK